MANLSRFPNPADVPLTTFENEYVMPDGVVVKDSTTLSPKQIDYLKADARFVCFGGARGPGKTRSLAEKAKRQMLRWPGIPILILRKDLQDLKRTTMTEFLRVVPKQLYDPKYGGQYNKAESSVRFANGSYVIFGPAKDASSYRSMNLGSIYIDEAHEVDEAFMVDIQGALRWTSGQGSCKLKYCATLGAAYAREHHEHPVYQTSLCTNPHPGWIKERFWEPWKNGHERPNHLFIPATAYDNPFLPPSFIPDLLENNTATWVRNFIEGDWSAFENMVWPRWNRAVHRWRGGPITRDMFTSVEGGIDYGGVTEHAHRTAAYLTGILHNGQKLTFWEYSEQGAASANFFAEVRNANLRFRVNGWDADSSQHRANELLREGGVAVFDSDRSAGAVKDGLNQVHRLLQLNATGEPEIYVSEEACPRLMSGIETYQIDPKTGQPVPNQEDDEVNAWRYNIMRITKMHGAAASGPLTVVTTNASSTREHPSSIIKRIKAARAAKVRAAARAMDRDLEKAGYFKK